MKKGVAVPYIIAILLGVGVIGLIGYWLFVSGGRFGSTAKESECTDKLTEFCNEWLRVGTPPRGALWDATSCNQPLGIAGTNIPGVADCAKLGINVRAPPVP